MATTRKVSIKIRVVIIHIVDLLVWFHAYSPRRTETNGNRQVNDFFFFLNAGVEDRYLLTVEAKDLQRELDIHGRGFENTVYDLEFLDTVQRVLPRCLQWHPCTSERKID